MIHLLAVEMIAIQLYIFVIDEEVYSYIIVTNSLR